jgi:hypothetical protein
LMDLPSERTVSDSELAILLARAMLDNRFNPGSGEAFTPDALQLLNWLGVRDPSLRDKFLRQNPPDQLKRRLEEYCWRLVGLGYLLPKASPRAFLFDLTERGRAFMSGFDPTAMMPGGLDAKLATIGYAFGDMPRQYSRLAQDCFLAGHYESSVVMLGVANEAVVEDLVTAFVAIRTAITPTLRALGRRSTAREEIAWLLEALNLHRRQIRSALEAKGLDADWIEPLRDILQGTTQAIRLTRSDFAHPIGVRADQVEALQLFALFPRFAELAMRAVGSLAGI